MSVYTDAHTPVVANNQEGKDMIMQLGLYSLHSGVFFLLCDVCFTVYGQIYMTVNSSITQGRQAISLYHQSSTLSDWTLNKLFNQS